MKWSSSSNSSLSNGNVVTMALNNSNNNNSSISSSGSNTSASYGQNGGVTRTAATVRRHASDRRSIFYTDPSDMEIFLKNHNNKKVRCIIRISFSFPNLSTPKHEICFVRTISVIVFYLSYYVADSIISFNGVVHRNA